MTIGIYPFHIQIIIEAWSIQLHFIGSDVKMHRVTKPYSLVMETIAHVFI